ncbi:MAG: hypothetical protein ACR2HQ_16145 [Ilumatobacteraceae bacterium]
MGAFPAWEVRKLRAWPSLAPCIGTDGRQAIDCAEELWPGYSQAARSILERRCRAA